MVATDRIGILFVGVVENCLKAMPIACYRSPLFQVFQRFVQGPCCLERYPYFASYLQLTNLSQANFLPVDLWWRSMATLISQWGHFEHTTFSLMSADNFLHSLVVLVDSSF